MAETKVTALFSAKGIQATQGAIAKVQKSISSLAASFARVRLIAGAAFAAIAFGLQKLAKRGGEIQGLTQSFQGLTGGAAQAEEMLSAVSEALDETVSRADIMRQVNNALLLGLPATAEQMANLANVAQRLGRAVGRTATESFGDLVTGIGRQSRMILDNLGIIVDTQQAYDDFAARLGVSTDALTAQQQKLAFYEATLASATSKVAQLGEENLTASDRLGQLGAKFANLRDRLAEILASSPGLSRAVEVIGDRFQEWIDFVNQNAGAVEGFFNRLIESMTRIATAVFDFVPTLISLFEFVVNNASTILRVFGVIAGIKAGMAFGPIGIGVGALGGAFLPEIVGGIAGPDNEVQRNAALQGF